MEQLMIKAIKEFKKQYPLGEVRFDRELTTDECAKYGLKLDKGWEHEKAVYLEMIKEQR